MSIARDRRASLSDTVAMLVRRGLSAPAPTGLSRSERTGLEVLHLGGVISTDDVRSLDDEP